MELPSKKHNDREQVNKCCPKNPDFIQSPLKVIVQVIPIDHIGTYLKKYRQHKQIWDIKGKSKRQGIRREKVTLMHMRKQIGGQCNRTKRNAQNIIIVALPIVARFETCTVNEDTIPNGLMAARCCAVPYPLCRVKAIAWMLQFQIAHNRISCCFGQNGCSSNA